MTQAESKPLLRALQGETVSPPPVWLMRQAGRYLPEYRAVREKAGSFLDLCYTPEHAVEVTHQPIRRYGLDAAILFSDILVIPDGLGMSVTFRAGEGPVLQPLSSRADIEALQPERVETHLAPVFETLRRLRAELAPETTLIGFAGAPWTVATYMIEGGTSKDFQATKTWAYARPDDFQALIDRLVETTARYLIRQVEAGAEAVQVFDSWAGVLPDDQFHRWCLKPMRAIMERLRDAGCDVPVIGFPRGAGVLYEDYARESGVTAVSLDTTVPVDWAAEVLQPLCPVQGNLDPIHLVADGPGLEASVKRIVETLGRGPFIFNLGHGVVPQTSPDAVGRMVDMVRRYGA